jgi:hypothetical protein
MKWGCKLVIAHHRFAYAHRVVDSSGNLVAPPRHHYFHRSRRSPAATSRLDSFAAHAMYAAPNSREIKLPKANKKKPVRNLYTAADIKLLKQHSRAKTPVRKIAKQMKRTEGSLRQKALKLGIGLGHQR